jgi:hypothetical protein
MTENQSNKIQTKLERLNIVMNRVNIKDDIELAKAINYSQGYISEILSAKKGVPKTMGIKLEDKFNISRQWFDLGYEPMYKEAINPVGIPMYDSAATASGVEVYNDLVQDEPAFVVNIPQFRDCSFGKLVYGHSMYPTIESGTYVFCKSVSNKLHILPGEIYYIEYDNYGVVKRLQKGDSPENVLAVSDNDEVRKDGSRRYESYTIPFDSIRNIYLIKGHFKQSHN